MTVAAPEKPNRPWSLWLSQLAYLWRPLAMFTAALTFIGLFGSQGWFIYLCAIFRVQYAIVLLIGVPIFWATRSWIALAGTTAALAVNLSLMAPLYFTTSPRPASANVRILQMNVNSRNRKFDSALSRIRELAPQVLCLEEIDSAWKDALTTSLTDYPYRIVRDRPDNFGIALFSKLPIDDLRVMDLGTAHVPAITGVLRVQEQSARLLSVHVLPPRSEEYYLYRNEQFDRIAEFLNNEPLPVILSGDLNAAPWTPFFTKLCADARLVDSERGFGVQPTWPTNSCLFWIPIDHFLTRGNISVFKRFTAAPIGSDHFPVCIDLYLSK